MQAMVARILVDDHPFAGPSWPHLSDKDREANEKARRLLEAEDGERTRRPLGGAGILRTLVRA